MSITEQEKPAARPKPGVPKRRPESRRLLLRRMVLLGWPMALALAIALAGLSVDRWAERRIEGSPAADRALVDQAATREAVGAVSSAVTRIFTYTHTDPAATERAAARLLTGRAAAQYRSLFGHVRQLAPAQQLDLTTKVSRAGLIKLTRDGTAVLVVFLDQTATRKGRPSGSPVAAQLVVTARENDGWRISDLRAA